MSARPASRPLQKILFTTVVGPYGVDSESTRFKNPMSLLSNQVMRGQGHYTVQMAARAFAFDLFGVNLDADVAVLNFPQPAQLEAVLSTEPWDRVGISAIIPNFESLLETYRHIRRVRPSVAIDVGGHIANDEDVIRELVERIRAIDPTETFDVWRPGFEKARVPESPASVSAWLRREGIHGAGVTFVKRDGLDYYGALAGVGLKDRERIRAPLVDASVGKRVMGVPLPSGAAGLLIPDVGCPMKCNFCSTSHKFGGRFVRYLSTAEDILAVANAHADEGKAEMFVMSENFSLDTRRALELLRLMEEQRRPHKFSVFSSANGLIKLGVENIVKLGYSFVWIGLEESSGTAFKKSREVDLRELVTGLQAHGVEVLGSTILGFEHHRESDLDREVGARDQLRLRLQPVHALHADPGHRAARPDEAGGEAAVELPLSRHARAGPAELEPRPPLRRGARAAARPGVRAGLPRAGALAVPDDAGALERVREDRGLGPRARADAARVDEAAVRGLHPLPLRHGARPRPCPPSRGGPGARPAAGTRRGGGLQGPSRGLGGGARGERGAPHREDPPRPGAGGPAGRAAPLHA